MSEHLLPVLFQVNAEDLSPASSSQMQHTWILVPGTDMPYTGKAYMGYKGEGNMGVWVFWTWTAMDHSWQAPGELLDLEQAQPEQGQIWAKSGPWLNHRVHIHMHLFHLPDEVTGHKISKWFINPWVQRWHYKTEVNLQLLCRASWYIKCWHPVKPLPVHIIWSGCCAPNAKKCISLGDMVNKVSKD